MPFGSPIMTMPLGAASLFGQTFELHDLAIVGLLVVLEGVLSIDNALVLGILAKRLPKHLQAKALTYGLVGALVFRIIAIALASFLLKWTFAKFLGGAYLIYVAVSHFLTNKGDEHAAAGADGAALSHPPDNWDTPEGAARKASLHSALFWKTVIVIELTDIAFAVDSIVAAMALVGQQQSHDTGTHDKLWVVVTGGMLGVILMRFAAVLFIKLLEKFPRFDSAAYLLVVAIGAKLLVDWWFNVPGKPEVVNFHSPTSWAFWAFWATMAICFAVGFIPRRKPAAAVVAAHEEAAAASEHQQARS
jgi:YkoY family integral membrane protein